MTEGGRRSQELDSPPSRRFPSRRSSPSACLRSGDPEGWGWSLRSWNLRQTHKHVGAHEVGGVRQRKMITNVFIFLETLFFCASVASAVRYARSYLANQMNINTHSSVHTRCWWFSLYLSHSPSRPLEQPDCVESADSDVADMTELEKLDRPEAGLEKRAGTWPLHLSSTQEQAEPGLTLLQDVLPLMTTDAAGKKALQVTHSS